MVTAIGLVSTVELFSAELAELAMAANDKTKNSFMERLGSDFQVLRAKESVSYQCKYVKLVIDHEH